MGISGLLSAMQPATRPAHIQEFAGRTLLVDGATLLYKAAYVSAYEIALGLPPAVWLDASWQYIRQRIELFSHFGIIPIWVLDGRRSPLKRETDAKRSSIRQGYLRDGHAARDQALRFAEGSPEREAHMARARDSFQKAVKAPKELVLAVLARLKDCGVEILVAPYEADAQVAYLVRKGYGDGVVTEDSDLITYAALASRPFPILFKLDATGACVELTYDPTELSMRAGNMGPLIRSLRHMCGPQGGRLFLQASIFAGCDYLASICGVGPMSAWEMAVKCRTVPSHKRLERMVHNLPLKKRREAPGDYIQRAYYAELLFAYHWVYDPASRACVTYMPLRQQQQQQAPTAAAAAAAGAAAKGEEKGASPPVQEGDGEDEEGGGNGGGDCGGEEDGAGPVDKEDEAAAAVRAELIVIDDSSSDSLRLAARGQGGEQKGGGGGGGKAVPVLERPPREELGLEALDLPVVGPELDLEAVLGDKIDEQFVRGVAEARLHPETLQPLVLPPIPSSQDKAHSSSSSSFPPSRPSSGGSGGGGLPSFLQQQHAERPGVGARPSSSSSSAGGSASFLSPSHGGGGRPTSSGRRGGRPFSSSSWRVHHEPAGFRASTALTQPDEEEEGKGQRQGASVTFQEDKEAQFMMALVMSQKQRDAQQAAEAAAEQEAARQRQWRKRGHAVQEEEEDEWDPEKILADMSPARRQRARAAGAAAAAAAVEEDEDVDGAVYAGGAFPPSSPEFMYTLSGASATNSPMVAGGGCGWKENVARPSLPTLAEEAAGGKGDAEAEAEEDGGSGRGGGSSYQQQRPAGFKSGSINPFAVKPAASKPAPPPPASSAAARAVSREADAGDGGGHKKGSIVPQLGPKAPAPMPAPALTTFGGAGGSKGGGGGKGSGGGKGDGSGKGSGGKGKKADLKALPITGWLTAPKK